jgi:glycosidase
MGVNSFAFQDIVKNQQDSKYKDWFTIISYDDSIAGTKFKYQGWFGVPDLPEIREDENGIVDGPKQYIFECTKRWMAPNGNAKNGIDGWRLDVAFCVDHDFWKDWRAYVKSINPEAYLTAEVIDKIEVVKPYLEGDEFDAVMNYGFGVICSEFFINKKNTISVTEFDSLLRELRNAYPAEISYVMQNLYDSHDTQRFTSYLHNPDIARFRTWGEYFNKTHATNPEYNTGKPTEEEYKIQKLMALFQFTYVGAPMVYYGDEIGMWGANDPDCRKPMVWEDLKYDDEVYNWDGSKKYIADKVSINIKMLEYYKFLAKIRNNHSALQNGEFRKLHMNNSKGIYVFERINEIEKIVVIINNSNDETSVFISPENGTYQELLFGRDEYVISGEGISLKIPPKGGRILVKL